MITNKRARVIASEWHGGQWSGLYKVACNDDCKVLTVQDWDEVMTEADYEARKQWLFDQNRGVANDLFALYGWARAQRNRRIKADMAK